jgi:hypothetical protein
MAGQCTVRGGPAMNSLATTPAPLLARTSQGGRGMSIPDSRDRVGSPAPWEQRLGTPQPRDHIVQLYQDDDFLARAVVGFLGRALEDGDAAVIIATPPHAGLFARGLAAHGVDIATAVDRGQLTILDAERCLEQFMVNGAPDRAAFLALTSAIVGRARAAGHDHVRLFGEMVDMLRRDSTAATAQLEALWNAVLEDRRLALLCAYAIDNFDREAHRGILHQISRSHSYLIPVEDYERLDVAVDRAYDDVLGASGDPRAFRELVESRRRPAADMPAAAGGLLALRDLVPQVADCVLDRAGRHYRA